MTDRKRLKNSTVKLRSYHQTSDNVNGKWNIWTSIKKKLRHTISILYNDNTPYPKLLLMSTMQHAYKNNQNIFYKFLKYQVAQKRRRPQSFVQFQNFIKYYWLHRHSKLTYIYIYIFHKVVQLKNLRCGGIITHHFTANLLSSVPRKKFWKLVNVWNYDKILILY